MKAHHRLANRSNTRERKKRRTGIERRWPTAPTPNPIQPARCTRYGTPRIRCACTHLHSHARAHTIHTVARARVYIYIDAATREVASTREQPFRSIPHHPIRNARLASKLSPGCSYLCAGVSRLFRGVHAPVRSYIRALHAREYWRSAAPTSSNRGPIASTCGLECLFLSETSSDRGPVTTVIPRTHARENYWELSKIDTRSGETREEHRRVWIMRGSRAKVLLVFLESVDVCKPNQGFRLDFLVKKKLSSTPPFSLPDIRNSTTTFQKIYRRHSFTVL